jgi:Peptidase M61 N-terminal domain
MTKRFAFVVALLLAVSLTAAPITLRADATGAPSNVFHAHLTIPAQAGPMTLDYPKWIPGEHGPTGPINGLTGLRFSAGFDFECGGASRYFDTERKHPLRPRRPSSPERFARRRDKARLTTRDAAESMGAASSGR